MEDNGLEYMPKSPANTGVLVRAAQNAAQLESDAVELLAIWGCLNDAARSDLLAVARGLVAKEVSHD